jgi:thioredoxin-related protein
MKTLLLFLSFVVMCHFSHAQGILFVKGSYEELKAKAKEEHKQIFVDVYTTWCGPCKKMASEVFTRQDVGDFFNANFISVKLDAENEASHGFFTQYKASAYPTYFVLDADGQLLDQKVGSCSAESFIAMAKSAMTGSLAYQQAELRKRWESGERSYELVRDYIIKVVEPHHPELVRPAIAEFLDGLPEEELKSYPIFSLIKTYIGHPRKGFINSQIMELFQKYYDYYEQHYTNKYDTRAQGFYTVLYRYAVRMATAPYLRAGDRVVMDKQFDQQLELNKSLHLKYEDIYAACARAERLLFVEAYSDGIEAASTVLEKYGKDNPYLYEQLLYSIVLSKYLLKGDQVRMEKVMTIAKEALRVIPNKPVVTFYAAIQLAVKNYPEAIGALANKHFYAGEDVTNAIYPFLDFGNLRAEIPEKSFPEIKGEQSGTRLNQR